MEWTVLLTKKKCKTQSVGKWDKKVKIYCDKLEEQHTINSQYYRDIL